METSHAILAGLAALIVALTALVTQLTDDDYTKTESTATTEIEVAQVSIPSFLTRSFPDTDFTNASPAIANLLSGGPGKDGIPALDEPAFEPIADFDGSDAVQAIVLQRESETKVYPYNILNWHEIVNDTIDGTPVAVTFCPLCGSAITYVREVDGEETTLGVSGALIESNMVMYDRATESLWQQSTGEALAGARLGTTLELFPMQLSTIGELKQRHPDAQVLSSDTGYRRDYDRNPYSGYDENNDQFIFQPSAFSPAFPAKEIMVVFRVGEQVAATPWLAFADGDTKAVSIGDQDITLQKQNSELQITSATGETIPFYFEMWFSAAVQHGEGLVVI